MTSVSATAMPLDAVTASPHLATSLHWIFLPLVLPVLILPLHSLAAQQDISETYFPHDYLSPYSNGRHGSGRTVREIEECQHVMWQNRTFEVLKTSLHPPASKQVSYQLHKFADISERLTGKKYLIGTIAYIDNPYYTFSVLEPSTPGGCSRGYFSTRSTVQKTVGNRKLGCKLATNAGFFSTRTGKCLGNVVSDGRVVLTANNQQNANFGIRRDGSIVVGYIPDEEILNTTNPFRQLVSGVMWLVRNGTNYVSESKKLECSSNEETGRMETFVNVLSARTAIGHDAAGRLVMAQVEGQTYRRGANLVEFADLLVRHGVVNAINMDGGGSNTLVENNELLNYPSDHCIGNSQYRCPRAVSTAFCIHDVECLQPECNGHGSCDLTQCSCDPPWTGEVCDQINCFLTNCSMHGNCSDGKCECETGWQGDLCNEACPSNRYGPGCRSSCWCYGLSHCHPITGHCVCPPGLRGYSCLQKCEEGYYGVDCKERCTYPHCSGHGHCSALNGTCLCEDQWTGPDCNTSISVSISGNGWTDQYSSFPFLPSSTLPRLILPLSTGYPSSNVPLPSAKIKDSTVGNSGSRCDCRKQCVEEEAVRNFSSRGAAETSRAVGVICNPSNNMTQEHVPVDGPLQWVVALSLLIALLTLLIHTLLCYLTRRWAYMAVSRTELQLTSDPEQQQHQSVRGKTKKTKRRKPQTRNSDSLLHYSSSSDCSL